MNNSSRVIRLVAAWIGILVGVSLVISACGGDQKSQTTPDQSSAQMNSLGIAAPVEESIVSGDVAPGAAGAPPAEVVPESPNEDQGVALVSNESDVVARANATAIAQQSGPRLIVKNGELVLIVRNSQVALAQVTGIAARYGGYVISSEISSDTPDHLAVITIAVEVSDFESAMNDLREIGLHVVRDAASGQDVTTEYTDLDSRLHSLEATRDRILSFLEQAQTVQDALVINAQLADVESEIDQVQGRMNYLAGRSAFSTITVTLQEEITPTPTFTPSPTFTPTATPTPDRWSPKDTLDSAVDAQTSLVQMLVDLAIWVIIFLGPYLLVGGLILAAMRRWMSGRPPQH